MQQGAKLFTNGRSQAVRLPAEFRFDSDEVFIRRDTETGDVITSSKPDSRGSSLWEGGMQLRFPTTSWRTGSSSHPRNASCSNARPRSHAGQVGPQHVCISAITEAELRFGVAPTPDATRIAERVAGFQAIVDVLPWERAAANDYARLRATLERTGNAMANLDLMIAAHALARGITLVTNDHAFRRVDGLDSVQWSE